MSKNQKSLKKLTGYLVCLVTVIQVLFAIAWICCNVNYRHPDLFASNYIEASKNLVVDDYMGFLYALICKLFGTGLFLYLFQVFAVFLSGAFLLSSFFEGKKKYFLSTFIVTNPFIIQSIFSISPNAVSLSCEMALAGAFMAYIKKEKKAFLIAFFAGIVFLPWLNPDNLVVSVLFGAFGMIVLIKRKEKGIFIFLASLLILVFCSFGVNKIISEPLSYGRSSKTMEYLVAQRFAWPWVHIHEGFLSTYYEKDYLDSFRFADATPLSLSTQLGNKVEMKSGITVYNSLFGYFGENALKKGLSYCFKPVVKDCLLYLFTPFSVGGAMLFDIYNTGISNALGDFYGNSFWVSKFFLLISIFSSLLIAGISLISMIIGKRKDDEKNVFPIIALLFGGTVGTILSGAFWAIRGFNYQNALFIVFVWDFLVLLYLRDEKA